VYKKIEYKIPTELDIVAGARPEDYSQEVEGDLLIVVDDIALIVESKAVSLKRDTYAGNPAALLDDLEDMVGVAASQSERLATRIFADAGLACVDGTWIDLHHIREVHTIALTLDDLPAVSTSHSALQSRSLIPAHKDRLPWVVGLHDLQIICGLVGSAAEFVLYLRVREDPDVMQFFFAIDEMDLFLAFQMRDLFVTSNPDRRAKSGPLLQPTAEEKADRQGQIAREIINYTPLLDSWRNRGSLPEEKPKFLCLPKIQIMVEAIEGSEQLGRLGTAVALLHTNIKAQQELLDGITLTQTRVKQDQKTHTFCTFLGNSDANLVCFIWMESSSQTTEDAAKRHLSGYLALKQYQAGAPRGMGIGCIIDGEGYYWFFGAVLSPGTDPDMDALVEAAHLLPLTRESRDLGAGGEL
jgi:hypothetical protein